MRNQPLPGVYAWIALSSLVVAAVLPQPAAAKGLFESIFGFLGSKPGSTPSPRVKLRPRPSNQEMQRYENAPRSNPFGGNYSRPYSVRPSRGGRYKTVCVRLCDGYFFPISNSSRRRDFYNDAQQCQSRCDSDTRLFYLSPSARSIKGARDQRGLTYGKLKTAFLYRKTLKKGCECRPKPWSVAERMRHRTYALVAQDEVAGGSAVADAHQFNDGIEVVAAKPEMVGEGSANSQESIVIAAPAPVAVPRPPAPRAARRRRRVAPVRYAPRRLVSRRRRPLKKKSWGLGSSVGKPKYRWPGDPN